MEKQGDPTVDIDLLDHRVKIEVGVPRKVAVFLAVHSPFEDHFGLREKKFENIAVPPVSGQLRLGLRGDPDARIIDLQAVRFEIEPLLVEHRQGILDAVIGYA